jgi:S-adenosylmethionine:tRNA ribosyltransferase-isomerase
VNASVLDFTLPAELEAHEPPEARGRSRDAVRLLVGAGESVSHHQFVELPALLRPGDLLVVNTSGTLPAAVPLVGAGLTAHFSTRTGRADGSWLVELREAGAKGSRPYGGGAVGDSHLLPGGEVLTLREPYSRGRLWVAGVSGDRPVTELLVRYGQPIRYGYVPRQWPLSAYQTVFATEPGSAEMPGAARPFTDRLVTRLVSAGIRVVPVLLHTGVASPEAHERPYPEEFKVSADTANAVNHARHDGGRVIAVGTTAVRALESATTAAGEVAAASGWTELVIGPDIHPVRTVDALLTGFHEPRASHLDMLAAIAGTGLLDRCYREALTHRYLWHEFGDLNLIFHE